MIRIVCIAILVLAVWLLLRWLALSLKRRNVDWAGLAFAAGFIALAVWLRSATGMG